MRKQKRESGQAMVEFALIIPIFILILFAVIDFGHLLSTNIAVTNAAREGARTGITCASDSDFSSRVENRVHTSAPDLKTSNLSISATKTGSSGNQDVVVTLEYIVEPLTPVGMLFWGSGYCVKGSCTMKAG